MLARRRLLAGLAALALPACRCGPEASTTPVLGRWLTLDFPPTTDSPDGERALLLAPPDAARRPLLVALHGRGESGRGLDVGARGFRDLYDLDRLDQRLRAPPLTAEDLLGFVTPERLAQLDASLAAAPYEGLAVATPYTPDLPDRSVAGAQGFARFVGETLLPRARAETGAPADRARTGIDGVSMGGRLSLLVGLSHPELFGAVGALQPALRVDEAEAFAALAREATSRLPLRLRLVSSEGDPFLPAVRATSAAMTAVGVAHELLVVPGPHDYVWNRGPGGAEMLLWHERALRGLASP